MVAACRIVQIASIAGHVGYGYPPYTAAKGGLARTRQFALELGAMRIRINSIRPGVFETGLSRESSGSPAVREAAIADTRLGRIGSSDDIPRAALFLVSDESEFIIGY